MNEERKLELLAYAKVCFEHCTNPFAATHLIKKKVMADECRDLSRLIAEIISDDVAGNLGVLEESVLMKEAEKAFMETQKE